MPARSVHSIFLASVAAAALLFLPSVAPVSAGSHPGSDPSGIAAVGSLVFFAATTAAHGRELWVTDGTAVGTHEVADINPAPGESSWPEELTAMGGRVFFFAYDGSGCALWKSDGTTDGTKRLGGGDLCEMGGLTKVGGQLLFTNYTGLWRSNGTVRGTREIAEIDSHNGPWAELNGAYYFFSSPTGDTWQLWKSDGTSAGTSVVTEMPLPPGGSYDPAEMISAGDLLYFRIGRTYPVGSSTDLWQSDGTAAGTRQVRDFDPELDQVSPGLTKVRGKVYFAVDVGMTGPGTSPALWKSNGTESGTKIVKRISPDVMTTVGLRLFLFADDGTGMALWKSRGTASTTTKVYPVALPGCPRPWEEDTYCMLDETPAAVGSRLFFPADSTGNGIELWVSDGTTAGTHQVKNIVYGGASSNPASLASIGSLLYFSARDANHGRELWVTDGTARGTHMVLDIN